MTQQPLSAPALVDPRAAAVLRRLEMDVTKRLDGLLHGNYRGLVPGQGSEPGEARQYLDGDDVRQIDWNVTARMGATHIRQTISDRELETWLVVDRSPSLDFGTADCTKAELALSAAASIALLTSHGGNRLGVLIGGRGPVATVPARQGRRHVMGALNRIAGTSQAVTGAQSTLPQLLERATGIIRRRGLICVVSDFLDEPDQWAPAIGALSARHEVLGIEICDPRELELPKMGVIGLVDAETGAVVEIDTNRESVRRRFFEAGQARTQAVHHAFVSHGADHLRLRTDEDWLAAVARHITRRKRRRANTAQIGTSR